MSDQSNSNNITAAFETPPLTTSRSPRRRRTPPPQPESLSPRRQRRRTSDRPIRSPPRVTGLLQPGRTLIRPIPRRGQLWPHSVVASPPRLRPIIAPPRTYGGASTSTYRSPPRRPRPINTSKYEKMLKELTKSAITNNRNARKNDNNNLVSSWMNESGIKAGKGNIPKNRRVFLMPDVNRTGVIKHVYDRKFINGMIESFEVGFNTIFPNDERFFTSPATRRKFSKKDIKAYPPTPTTRRLIRNRNQL